MKRANVFLAAVMIGLSAMPAFGEVSSRDNGAAQVKNVQTGARNATAGWTDIFDSVAASEGQSKNTAEKVVTGPVAGLGIGVRKAFHRTASGLIDLCTFWIPKKDPLLTPQKNLTK